MRAYGTFDSGKPQPADAVQTLLLAAAAGQAMDWPGVPAAASSNGSNIVRFTGMTTGNLPLNFMVNLNSTQVTVPTSGSSVTTGTTAGSTGNGYPCVGVREFSIPGWSTGWSAIAQTSGYVFAEVWKK